MKKIHDRCKININYPIEYDFRAKLHFLIKHDYHKEIRSNKMNIELI